MVVLTGLVVTTTAVVVAGFGVVASVEVAVVVVVLFVAGETEAPVDDVEPEEVMIPEAGVVVVADAGRVVSAVGSGGNGLDKTVAIISFRPPSD